MKVTPNLDVPIYRQIADSFMEDILSGRFAQGACLPSIRVLAHELDVSVITTIKAYKILQEEGAIVAVCGKGFFVNGNNLEKLRMQRASKIEEKLREGVRLARQAGITEQELVDELKTMIKQEWE
ncbi:MAG: GntR family transcriptional regulator [Ruminococcus sp.]|nr:GntR family transcriptional regulator [Ruminococcus sp.]